MDNELKEIVSDLQTLKFNSAMLCLRNNAKGPYISQEGLVYKPESGKQTKKAIVQDLFNIFLQEQYMRSFEFVKTMLSVKNSIKHARPNLFKQDYDLDQGRALLKDFNHLKHNPNNESDYKLDLVQFELNCLNKRLAKVRKAGVIQDYVLYANLDNQTVFCEDSDTRAVVIAELLANICGKYDLNPSSLIDAMNEKAKQLRAELIMGTFNPSDNSKSILLRVSQLGYLDFYRGYEETQIMNTMIRVSKFVQNSDADWHCIFVQSPKANYLSIPYTDFETAKKGILSMLRGDNIPKHIEANANWIKAAFQAINFDKWFYPSKKWNSSKHSISSYSLNKGLSPLPVDEFIKDNQAQVEGIISSVVKNRVSNVKIAFNKDLKKDYDYPLAYVIFQMLGSLSSVYPDHKQELEDFGHTMEKELLPNTEL